MQPARIRTTERKIRSLFQLVLLGLAATAFSLTYTSEAHAYAWLIKHRYGGCPTCHADPSGGELLTSYGRLQGELLLKMPYGDQSHSAAGSTVSVESSDFDSFDSLGSFDSSGAEPGTEGEGEQAETQAASDETQPPEGPTGADALSGEGDVGRGGFLWGAMSLPESLLLGGSYRHLLIYKDSSTKTFPMMADLYGQLSLGHLRLNGSVGVTRAPAGSPHGRAAQITNSQGDGLSVISRTHWVGYEFGEGQYLLRAGRINLPFGLRIPEHVMWVREATRTDRESDQQHGVALSYNAETFRGEVMGILGNYQMNPDEYRERGYSGYIEGMLNEQNSIGVSSLWTLAAKDRYTLEQDSHARTANGVFFRFTLSEPLVLFGEFDLITNSRRDLGYTGMLQADYEVVQGLHLIGTGEVLDLGTKYTRPGALPEPTLIVPGAGKPNTGFWATVDWYFFSHMSLRVDAVFRHTDPTQIWAQFHAYL